MKRILIIHVAMNPDNKQKSRRHRKLRFLSGSRRTNEDVPGVPPIELSGLTPIPPPAVLSLEDEENNVTPGAFAATPGLDVFLPQNPARITPALDTDVLENDGPYMVVANLVDDEEFATAEVVDPTDDARKRKYLLGGLGILFLLFLATGIALTIVLSRNDKSSPGNISSSGVSNTLSTAGATSMSTVDTISDDEVLRLSPSSQPTSIVDAISDDEVLRFSPSSQPTSIVYKSLTNFPSEGPTASSSELITYFPSSRMTTPPSEAPTASFMPSSESDAYLLSLLPDYTVQTIQADRNSPQGQAFEFVKSDMDAGFPEWRIQQRFALVTLFHATGGDGSWSVKTGWADKESNLAMDECQWYHNGRLSDTYKIPTLGRLGPERPSGSQRPFNDFRTWPNPCNRQDPLNATHGTVYQNLWLSNCKMKGTLPRELSLLTSLRSIDFDGQVIYGYNSRSKELPKVIPSKNKTEVLVGTLPSEIGLLKELQILFLAHSRLSGTLPVELFNLTSLRYLGLASNELQGPLGTEVGRLTNLEYFDIWSNFFTGTVPTEIGRLIYLQHIDWSKNVFSTAAPFNMISAFNHLRHLSVELSVEDSTSLVIPSPLILDFGRLSSLEYLALNGCLGGTIPTEINSLTKLSALSIASPYLTGDIPTWIATISSLVSLRIASSQINGSIPAAISNLTGLRYLDLSGNALTGTIPSALGNLRSLLHLDLSANAGAFRDGGLTGSIPQSFGENTAIAMIPGETSSSLFTLPVLERLDLSRNKLLGMIPTQLANFSTLKHLDLAENKLTGGIPVELASLTDVCYVDIGVNMGSGFEPTVMCGEFGQSFGCESQDICNCTTSDVVRCQGYPITANLLLTGPGPMVISLGPVPPSYIDTQNEDMIADDTANEALVTVAAETSTGPPTGEPTRSWGTLSPRSVAPEISPSVPTAEPGLYDDGSGSIPQPPVHETDSTIATASTKIRTTAGARKGNVFCHPPLLCE